MLDVFTTTAARGSLNRRDGTASPNTPMWTAIVPRMSIPDDATLTTAAVAAALGVSASTVRRWITTDYLPEPGWTHHGRRRQRAFTDAWLQGARAKLAADREDGQ